MVQSMIRFKKISPTDEHTDLNTLMKNQMLKRIIMESGEAYTNHITAILLHKKLCNMKDRLKSHKNKKLWVIEELNQMIWLSDQLINHKTKLEDSNHAKSVD